MKGLVKRFNSSRSVVQIAHSCQVNRALLRLFVLVLVVVVVLPTSPSSWLWSAPRLRGRPSAVGNIELWLRRTGCPRIRARGVVEYWSVGVLRFVLGMCVGPSPGGIASSRSVAAGNPGRARVPARREDVPPPNGVFSSAIKTRPRFRPRSARHAGRGRAPSRAPQLLGAIFRKTKYTTKASPNPTNQA